uniref:Protein 3 n=1 Tax=Phlox pilosa virus 1 TaxID=2793736 RepID=A0A8D9PH50_9RHAB|nr:TPA_asm: protein 3 [Phlox pilosa virus 1]
MSKKAESSFAQFDITPIDPNDNVSGGIFDPYAPGVIPKEKVDFALKWSIRARGNDTQFDFGKIPLAQVITSAYKGVKTLNSPEIHIVWKSHVPPTGGQDVVNISLMFTQYEGFGNKLQVAHAHPPDLDMHHIFYPRNTCNIEKGGIIPWAIDIHIEGEEYKKEYVVADVYIRLKGYAQPVSSASDDRESELISLVPLTTPIQGVTLSKPRQGGEQWVLGKIKRGTSSEKNVKKLLLLQRLGVDVEGASILKLVGKLIAAIPDAAVGRSPSPDLLVSVGKKVNEVLRRSP